MATECIRTRGAARQHDAGTASTHTSAFDRRPIGSEPQARAGGEEWSTRVLRAAGANRSSAAAGFSSAVCRRCASLAACPARCDVAVADCGRAEAGPPDPSAGSSRRWGGSRLPPGLGRSARGTAGTGGSEAGGDARERQREDLLSSSASPGEASNTSVETNETTPVRPNTESGAQESGRLEMTAAKGQV